MAFFKSFQTNLPSVNISSILDSVSSRVDELANSVSDATYAVSDQLTEGVTTIVKKVQDTEEGDNASAAAAQDGGGQSSESKPRSKSIWQIARDNEPETAANESGENPESAASQLEWEWRDGCWRVKLTAAELAEEERKKQERKEMDEQREQRRRERQAKRTEAQRKREEQGEVSRRESENEAEPVDEGGKSAVKEEEEEEEVKDEEEEEEEEQEEEVAKTKRKKKKSDRKKKEEVKKDKTEEREKSKKKRKSKKKKGKEEAPSDSEEGEKEEEERGPEPMAQQRASAWGSKEGSSSEASSERATIQRIHKDASLNELQPPPYPREEQRKTSASSQRSSRGRRPSHRSTAPAGSHQASEEDQEEQEEQGEEEEEADSESYLNKACDEDIPSDSTAVLGQEDVPPLPAAYEPEPMAKYGTLDVAFEYDSGEQLLAVTVTAATDIPALKQTGNISWQVHMVLLPTKKQRAKTGVQKGPCPVFTETFKFLRVEQDALGDYAVRFRLYSIRRMKKEKVLGEKVFQLTKLNLHGKMALPVTLEPGSEAAGCGSVVSVSRSGGALSYRSTEDSLPELLLGLVYNSTTGRLSAEVIQGSHFKTSATEKPIDGLFCCVKHVVGGQLYIMRDTYVKLVMLDSKGKQMSKCRTGVCRGQPSPTYRESFVFQVSLFQLSEVSLILSVFWRRSSLRPRERLGGVCLGLNSTSDEQSSHWNQMREAEGQQVCHWHTLTDT